MIGHASRLFIVRHLLRSRELQSVIGSVYFNRFGSISSRNMSLLLNKTLINGKWVSSATNEQLVVLNPADGSVVGHVPDLTAVEAQQAVQAANDAFYSDEWSKLTAKERSGLLKVCNFIYGYVLENIYIMSIALFLA